MPSPLTENEVLSRHKQALSDAKIACERLARFEDPDLIAPRGAWYRSLKENLEALEGSARQMAHFRGDARWVRFASLYGRTRQTIQPRFVARKWRYFRDLIEVFLVCQRSLDELQAKTGRLGLILPQRASEWAVLPDYKPLIAPPPRMMQ